MVIESDNNVFSSSKSLVFLIGDFNQYDNDPAYSLLTGERYIGTSSAENTFIDLRKEYSSDQSTPTWVEYSSGKPEFPPMIIDYIFAADNGALSREAASWKAEGVKIVDNEFEMEGKQEKYRYSDHRTIVARLSSVK